MKNEKIEYFLKKYWTVIWLVAALISCFGIYAYAKYGEAYNVTKRVIRTCKNYTNLFSSNYLTVSKPTQPKTQIPDYDGNTEFDIEIWNYDRKHPTNFCHEDITYTLTAKLVYPNGDSYSDYTDATINSVLDDGDIINLYRVTTTNGVSTSTLIGKLGYSTTDNEVNVAQTIIQDTTIAPAAALKLLAANGSTGHSYKLEFPSGLIDKNVYVYLKAEPTTSDLALDTLGAYFYVKTQTVNLSTGWSGMIGEYTSSNAEETLPKKYDAYNFIITGSGTEKKRLYWDANIFTPNAQEMNEMLSKQLEEISSQDYTALIGTDNGLNYVDVTLDAASNGGRYDIQFYIKDGTAKSAIEAMTSWTTMNEKLKLTAVPSATP